MNNLIYVGNTQLPPDQYRKKIQHYSFSLQDKIGKGYSSVVYKGLNDHTGETVAIKVINLKSLKDQIAKNMLESQLECLRKIDHPNLLKCYDNYTTINNSYIITEYCNQGDLANQLKKKIKYTQQQFISIFKDIYSGYKKLNQYGYVHRDLKPANLLMKDNIIKIADFGFVKKYVGPYRQLYNVGTPLYMSPEATRDNIYTAKSDIWSIGVVCYQLLAGSPPWDCKSETQLRQKINRNNIRYDTLNVSKECQDLISRCIEIDEARRITLGEIEYHPWVKKNIIKSVPKFFMKLEIKSQSISPPKQGNRILATKQVENVQNPQKRTNNNNNKSSDSLDILISMLNFSRFLYKINQVIRETDFNVQKKNQIGLYIKLQLKNSMKLHENIINSKQNLIGSNDWNTFINSLEWQKYKCVAQTYLFRYKSLNIEGNPLICDDFLINNIKQLQNIIENNELYINQLNNLILLDYLITYYQLKELFIGLKQNYKKFIEQSQIDQIMMGKIQQFKPKKIIFNNIKQKIHDLAI